MANTKSANTQKGPRRKKHHFVSITYLKGFCDEHQRLYAFDKDVPLRRLYVSPKNAAFESYYYSARREDGSRDNDSYEDLWNKVETHWPHVLSSVKAGRADAHALFMLYAYMTIMRTRVPAARDYHESLIALRMREEVKLLAQLGKLPAKLKAYEDELDTVPMAVNREQTLTTMSDDMRKFGDLTRTLGFEVLLNQTDVPFITSDNPVAYFDPTAKGRPYEIDRKVELYFPLDKSAVLRGTHRLVGMQNPRLRVVGNTTRIGEINRVIARFAYRSLYMSELRHAGLATAYAQTSPVLDARSERHDKGVHILHRHRFGPRPALVTFRPEPGAPELTDEDLPGDENRSAED